MALLNQYAEDFALVRRKAAKNGKTFELSIRDAQIDLVLHLIAVFGEENRSGEKSTARIPVLKQGNIVYFPERRMYA